jgi:hypothetical protein
MNIDPALPWQGRIVLSAAMNLRLQAPTARHLGASSFFAARHRVNDACVAHLCARPDLVHIWRFRYERDCILQRKSQSVRPE